MLRIVLDTNCLFVSLSRKSKYRAILDALSDKKYILVLSNEIFFEYMEVITKYGGNTAGFELKEIISTTNNLELVDIYFNWNLINNDPEDNKFVDCALAGNADFIVTDDKHFEELKKIDFPKINTITTEEFLKLISEN